MAKIGISSLGLAIPPHAFLTSALAMLRGANPEKYAHGIGCEKMSIALDKMEIVHMASRAAKRALESWPGSLSDIGMLVVGTESSVDESRPLSAFVADELGLSGAIRSYEVKHACYGGTVAFKQALEWLDSKASSANQAALVIAADTCYYEPKSPPEPTQGAGAVAFILTKNPTIASFDIKSYPYSRPVFDFWRPFGTDFPIVEAKSSVACYSEALFKTVEQFLKQSPDHTLDDFKALCCHVPFPKMALKGVKGLFLKLGYTPNALNAYVQEKVTPYFEWNKVVGNAYTASLWISVVNALKSSKPGDKMLCFSYGSGYGAELLVLDKVLSIPTKAIADFEHDLNTTTLLSATDYHAWQEKMGWV
ncbi:MAG TPA: hydroxymethylglutaryl-CoA synthase [Alphaproteobacteria bacterium]|nr:hydroxymethylglutaryl-CoA synthase [Alphaproteobacteria bacterium]